MKVQCDFCSTDEASIFCCADQAALCRACDLRVHRANKLAGKHLRLALSAPSQPVCDICQEKSGFVFCQQDRAILCHDCDAPIHSANELTKKHNRFLLTGVQLSSSPIPDAQDYEKSLVAIANDQTCVTINSNGNNSSSNSNSSSSNSSSSIAEYLIKTLPGYRVEDLLVDDAVTAAKDAFYKVSDMMPFMEADLDIAAVTEEFPIWVPDVGKIPQPKIFSGGEVGSVSLPNQKQNYGVRIGRERWSEDSFMVPQINSGSNKRPGTCSGWDF